MELRNIVIGLRECWDDLGRKPVVEVLTKVTCVRFWSKSNDDGIGDPCPIFKERIGIYVCVSNKHTIKISSYYVEPRYGECNPERRVTHNEF